MNDEKLRDAYERGLPRSDGSPALDDVSAERLRRLVEGEGSESERLRTLDVALSSAEGRRELEIAWAAARAARPPRRSWQRFTLAASVLIVVGLGASTLWLRQHESSDGDGAARLGFARHARRTGRRGALGSRDSFSLARGGERRPVSDRRRRHHRNGDVRRGNARHRGDVAGQRAPDAGTGVPVVGSGASQRPVDRDGRDSASGGDAEIARARRFARAACENRRACQSFIPMQVIASSPAFLSRAAQRRAR